MATLNLGRLKPVFRGAWNNATAYNVDDIVVRTNESYISIQAGSNQDPASASAYWTKIAAKGADGTDIGATLANKEIAFKTNAGAVDGIPIGNAGEFLKVNSGATGYEYGAVSSDFVKIAEFSHSGSNVTNFNMDNIFSATYPVYKVYLTGLLHASTGSSGWIRVIKSDGAVSSSNNYEYAWKGKTSAGSDVDGYSGGASHFQVSNDLSSDNEKTSSFEFTIYRPYQTTEHKHFSWHASTYCNNSSSLRYFTAGGHWKTYGTAIRGLNYTGQSNSDKVKQAKAVVYGLKGAY